MDVKHIEGKNRGKILLYALSTCVWCKKTKRLLNSLGVAYDYVDVDLLGGEEMKKAKQEVTRWNPRCSFPTTIVNNNCIVGFDEKKLREAIGNE